MSILTSMTVLYFFLHTGLPILWCHGWSTRIFNLIRQMRIKALMTKISLKISKEALMAEIHGHLVEKELRHSQI